MRPATPPKGARQRRRRFSSLARAIVREPGLLAIAGVFWLLDGTYSVLRQDHFGSGFDLAIFDQAVWHYSRFEAPFSSIKGENLLGDHFHPLIAVLAPLYWVWSDARVLLIAQAGLVAASIVPVFYFARPRLGRTGAHLLAGAYAAFWAIQAGVGYEFHEVAFAPPLIAAAILAIDRRRWGWFWIAIGLLVLVKEDLSLLVVCFGVYLVSIREARRGATAILLGIVWFELATRVLIPHFAGGRAFSYWTFTQFGHDLPDALVGVLKAPWRIFTLAVTPSAKLGTIALLFTPFLFLSLASRWAILAVPLLAERFLSTNRLFWITDLHYSLTIAPILAISAAAGLVNLRRWSAAVRAVPIERICAAMCGLSLGLNAVVTDGSPLHLLLRPETYRTPALAAGVHHAIAHLPPQAAVLANDALLPHLSERPVVGEIAPGLPPTRYLIADLGVPLGNPTGNASFSALDRIVTGELAAMTPVFYESGWAVLRRPDPGTPAGNGVLVPLTAPLARRLLGLDSRWHVAVNAAVGGYDRCASTKPAGDHPPAGCPPDARALRSTGKLLADALLGAAGELVGGCRSLDLAARAAAGALTSDLATGPLTRSSETTVRQDLDVRDLPARPDQFLVLCYPRTPASHP